MVFTTTRPSNIWNPEMPCCHCGQEICSDQKELSGLYYLVHSSGLETSEFIYKPMRWKKKYRFAVVQTFHPKRTYRTSYPFLDGQIQLTGACDQYETNPLNIWRFYNSRAAVELIIKELKGDYPL